MQLFYDQLWGLDALPPAGLETAGTVDYGFAAAMLIEIIQIYHSYRFELFILTTIVIEMRMGGSLWLDFMFAAYL